MKFFTTGIIFFFILTQSAFAQRMAFIDKPLPAFDLPQLDNSFNTFSNHALCGHIALINIWASWCSACQHEHPILMRIKTSQLIPIYGVNYEDNPENAKRFLENSGNPFTLVAMDSDGAFADTLNVYGLPETLLIDANGKIQYRYSGALTDETWQTTLLPVIKQLNSVSQKFNC